MYYECNKSLSLVLHFADKKYLNTKAKQKDNNISDIVLSKNVSSMYHEWIMAVSCNICRLNKIDSTTATDTTTTSWHKRHNITSEISVNCKSNSVKKTTECVMAFVLLTRLQIYPHITGFRLKRNFSDQMVTTTQDSPEKDIVSPILLLVI